MVRDPFIGSAARSSFVAVPETFPLAIIAEIESVVNGEVAFGDTDQDGLNEIVTQHKSVTTFLWQLVIVEEQGDNSYRATYPLGLAVDLIPYATGDLDNDGRMEIIGQYSGFVRVYESRNTFTFPTDLVWQSPPMPNVAGITTTGDTDGDGRMEIIHSRNGFGGTGGIVIFENTADNSYAEVFAGSTPGNVATGEKVIADLDGDGWQEIALCGNGGMLYVFESFGNDAWHVVWSDSTGMHNAYASEGGWDTDRNGRPELFIMGNNFEADTWDSRVYEAVGNDQFQLVANLAIPNPNSGIPNDALGDLDGDGDGEYVMETGDLWIFDSPEAGQWHLIGTLSDPGDKGLAYSYDLNGNGVWEIVWRGNPTWVLEHPVTSDTSRLSEGLRGLRVFPNPVRFEARVAWPMTAGDTGSLVVYDAAGRLQAERRVAGTPFVWSTRGLPAGIYFLRLKNAAGATLASGRAVVRR